MIAIIDNDVILKLARWDLLGQLPTLLSGDCNRIYHLSTCFHALCGRPARMEKTGCDQASADRIRAFCSATTPITEMPDTSILELLTDIPGIDVGEVQIFAIAAGDPEAITYMCDKRSLVALAASLTAVDVASLLAGRVKCLEQVMGEFILLVGVENIGNKVLTCFPIADTAITIAFRGYPGIRPEPQIWQALYSYYEDLRHATGALLAPFPTAPCDL